MRDNISFLTQYKNMLLKVPGFRAITSKFQRDQRVKERKIIENILRETYHTIINKELNENEKKIALKKRISTVFVGQQIFAKIERIRNIRPQQVDELINEFVDILLKIEKSLVPRQIKEVFELIICSFNQPR
ncbi:MAG: hypothetical protein ACTSVV_13470 [Promethearchaeota archaeon]